MITNDEENNEVDNVEEVHEEKTFTQAEVNDIVKKRLYRQHIKEQQLNVHIERLQLKILLLKGDN